ncbi:MAG: hypothetical protein ACTSQ8_07995 [Candidatus Helarchaeota archaeon]
MIPQYKRFNLYRNTVRNPLFGTWLFDDWQKRDMNIVIDPDIEEIMLLRNRGGSKTRDGTILSVWFGYQKNKHGDPNRVLWYAGSESQLEQAIEYFEQNRYVSKVTSSKVTLHNGNVIKLRVMTKKQAASPRADVIFFDEEQDMDPKIYSLALGTQVGGGNKKIHMGTTELDTKLDDNFQKLQPKGMVLEHHVDEMSWTTEEEELKKYEGEPQFVIDSQLYCKWVRAGGVVFENVEERELTKYELEHDMLPGVHYGVDPNPKNGHTLVGVRYLGNEDGIYGVYVFEEIGSKDLEFLYPNVDRDDSELFSLELQKRLVHDVSCEIEENAGEEFLKTFYRITNDEYQGEIDVFYWNEENKHDRIISIRKHKIIVNPHCKETLHHIRTAVWNPKEPKAKLLKTPDQHYLDSFIHACHREDSIDVHAY